jgi:hypothetical protein
VRRAAAIGLGTLQVDLLTPQERYAVQQRALVALESGAQDGEWVVRYAVATAMERITPRLQELEEGRHRAVKTLQRLADDAQEEAPVVCLRARLALSRLSFR